MGLQQKAQILNTTKALDWYEQALGLMDYKDITNQIKRLKHHRIRHRHKTTHDPHVCSCVYPVQSLHLQSHMCRYLFIPDAYLNSWYSMLCSFCFRKIQRSSRSTANCESFTLKVLLISLLLGPQPQQIPFNGSPSHYYVGAKWAWGPTTQDRAARRP